MVVSTLAGITVIVLFVIYAVWVLVISGQVPGDIGGNPVSPRGVLLGLIFLVSLAGLAYLFTCRDRNGIFAAPTVAVTLLILSYGMVAGYILFWVIGLASEAGSFPAAVRGIAPMVPLLTVTLTLLLCVVARTTTGRRHKAAKNWLYLAPPSFFLVCTSLGVLGRLAS